MSTGQIALVTDAQRLLADEPMQHKYLGMTSASEAV
jgi:hypothetical protein